MTVRTIWKFPLSLTADRQTFDIPAGAEVVKVDAQDSVPCLWAIVDPSALKIERTFGIVGTGHPIPPDFIHYIGSCQTPPYVWHVFESGR